MPSQKETFVETKTHKCFNLYSPFADFDTNTSMPSFLLNKLLLDTSV